MSCSTCTCPLCQQVASASDIDHGNLARVYCTYCFTFDITRRGKLWVDGLTNNHRKALMTSVKQAPDGQILVICGDNKENIKYEVRNSMPDKAAPSWL